MMKSVKPGLMIPSPDTFVKSAIKTVGFADETNGYWFHTIEVVFLNFFDYLAPLLLRAGTLSFHSFVRGNYEKLLKKI